jgi:hypothetical protein
MNKARNIVITGLGAMTLIFIASPSGKLPIGGDYIHLAKTKSQGTQNSPAGAGVQRQNVQRTKVQQRYRVKQGWPSKLQGY